MTKEIKSITEIVSLETEILRKLQEEYKMEKEKLQSLETMWKEQEQKRTETINSLRESIMKKNQNYIKEQKSIETEENILDVQFSTYKQTLQDMRDKCLNNPLNQKLLDLKKQFYELPIPQTSFKELASAEIDQDIWKRRYERLLRSHQQNGSDINQMA